MWSTLRLFCYCCAAACFSPFQNCNSFFIFLFPFDQSVSLKPFSSTSRANTTFLNLADDKAAQNIGWNTFFFLWFEIRWQGVPVILVKFDRHFPPRSQPKLQRLRLNGSVRLFYLWFKCGFLWGLTRSRQVSSWLCPTLKRLPELKNLPPQYSGPSDIWSDEEEPRRWWAILLSARRRTDN